ncbi:hypothetical protein BT96DRAFT_998159 [Gymnopus androsaceus JB14]|uniref:Uncharacterized protein n=1 Tax=Gymnopus androsaceus JB14 TaxID=1447944 RepID=A0A6A4HB18_9AGAR|nr:hypothetical protein BT96DRAFT_998159 [Gymnopus androsaceus JB14]
MATSARIEYRSGVFVSSSTILLIDLLANSPPLDSLAPASAKKTSTGLTTSKISERIRQRLIHCRSTFTTFSPRNAGVRYGSLGEPPEFDQVSGSSIESSPSDMSVILALTFYQMATGARIETRKDIVPVFQFAGGDSSAALLESLVHACHIVLDIVAAQPGSARLAQSDTASDFAFVIW